MGKLVLLAQFITVSATKNHQPISLIFSLFFLVAMFDSAFGYNGSMGLDNAVPTY